MVNVFVAHNIISHSSSTLPHGDITAFVDMAGSAAATLDPLWFGLDVLTLLLTGLYLVKLLVQGKPSSHTQTIANSSLPSSSIINAFAWVEPSLMQPVKRSLGEQQVRQRR